MTEYLSKTFSADEAWKIDEWLNMLVANGYETIVVGYVPTAIGALITVQTYKSRKHTIDPLPQDPTIDYDAGNENYSSDTPT